MGAVFARGLLRLGHPVYPVTRATDMEALSKTLPSPELVLVAVAEKDLQPVLQQIPEAWKNRLALLQNELLPRDWSGLEPTVISIWFEKKKGMDSKVIIPSPVFGPNGRLLVDALGAVDIPARLLADTDELLFELVVKNLYILASNIAGLRTGGNVGELWDQHQEFARRVVAEVIAIQEALTGEKLDQERLIAAMAAAFRADPTHQCMGRSAPARLARALEHGELFGLELPTLKALGREIS